VQDDPLEINAAAFRDADATLRGGAPRTPSSPKIARDSRHNALSGYMGQGSSAWGRFHVGRDRAFASGDLSGAGLALSSVSPRLMKAKVHPNQTLAALDRRCQAI
jgi:hypothetical protein